MPLLRLDRLLASQGEGSRKEVHALLRGGRIQVDGKIATAADQKVDPAQQRITVGGRALHWRAHLYLMMNKPVGVISASRDPKARTVLDLLPPELRLPGLFPAGRLDKDTEGFLLITDDGVFAHDILAPRRHVEKVYLATLDKPADDTDAAAFAAGLVLEDGLRCLPARLWLGEGTEAYAAVREGKFHQVRRMFAACGKQVLRLRRTQIGGLILDPALAPGEARELSEAEVELIKLHKESTRDFNNL
ncbi:MAG: pseudouridine synthase [Ethanoligenens sp.]|uniref:pseudouridine synthase n=1 Tax=Ethanoligenens sp. TaxID=2099655 RepID=UPI0039ED69C7